MQVLLVLDLLMFIRCMWVRRATWPSRWDGTATNSIMLLTVSVVMKTSQVGHFASPRLYRLTGVWNLDELFGHICYIAALMGLIAHGAFRLKMTDRGRQRFLHRNIVLVGSVAIPLMVAFFVWGGGENRNIDDMGMTEPSPEMYPYWIVLRACSLYLAIILAFVMWELRKNPVSRFSCTLYLIGCALAILIPALGLLNLAVPIDLLPPIRGTVIRAEVFVFGLAASWSWSLRLRRLRGAYTWPKAPEGV